MGKFLSLLRKVRRDGILRSIPYACDRTTEALYERRFGIRTTGRALPADSLRHEDPECHRYVAIPYEVIRSIIHRTGVEAGKDVFLDYGSGLGRVVIMAATYPFKRVIDVELSREQNDLAGRNLEQARRSGRLRCDDVELVHVDAAKYVLPNDVNRIFFFSPFSGTVLADVLENVRRSLLENRRQATVVFCNPPYFEATVQNYPWLAKRDEFRKRCRIVIYECVPDRLD